MKYSSQHLNIATSILASYDGSLPLHHHLKSFFSTQKKFGSRDRRNISHLCYCYFRLGHALKNANSDERILIVLFLSGQEEWIDLFPEDWRVMIENNLDQKISAVRKKYSAFSVEDIFPFNPLSSGLAHKDFSAAHLFQPKVFIRTRKGKERVVEEKLMKAKLNYEKISKICLAFLNSPKLETLLSVNEEYVVQDYNSQRVGEWMSLAKGDAMEVWDCCAASGGKSIMAFDLLPIKNLWVTDVRSTIIETLRLRFKEAGIKNYTAKVADATNRINLDAVVGKQKFDLVICDAPCSGSGTWGRTPEQLYYFTEDKISYYSKLQNSIASNALAFVKTGGYILYVTCSVFKAENEEVVEYLQKTYSLELLKLELLEGYELKADTMFAALLRKVD